MIKSLDINEINFDPNKNFLFDPQFAVCVSQPSQVELDKSNIVSLVSDILKTVAKTDC